MARADAPTIGSVWVDTRWAHIPGPATRHATVKAVNPTDEGWQVRYLAETIQDGKTIYEVWGFMPLDTFHHHFTPAQET